MNLRLLVSEPWDFKGPDGPNLILAQLDCHGYGKYGEWIVCSCTPFLIDNTNVSSLLLSLRHSSKESILAKLQNGKEILANAYWRSNGEKWDKETIKKAEIDSSIIGGWLILSARTT